MADESAIDSQIITQSESEISKTLDTTTESNDTTTTTKSKETTVRVVEKRHIVVDMNGTSKRFGTESHENPFMADGELSKKAEYILRHSTISRSEIRISDPDLSKTAPGESVTEESPLVRQEAGPLQAAGPPDQRRLNGTVEPRAEPALSPQAVQVEVATANASQPQAQHAEQVKLKDPKCKCCVIM